MAYRKIDRSLIVSLTFGCALFLALGVSGCAKKVQEESLALLPETDQVLADSFEEKEEYLQALKYWRQARRAVDSKIDGLSVQLAKIAEQYAQQGVVCYDQKKGEEAFVEFVEALRADPQNLVALDYFINRYEPAVLLPYIVNQGDTFEIIAENVYDSHTDTFLVDRFAGIASEEQLVEGETLELPVLSSFYSQPLLDYKHDLHNARTLFHAKKYLEVLPFAEEILNQHPEDTEASYIKNKSSVYLAERYVDEKNYRQAILYLTVVDPAFKNVEDEISEIKKIQRIETEKNTKRRQMNLFYVAESLVAQDRLIEALDVFNEIDPEFVQVETAIAIAERKSKIQAATHYKEGVKLFIDDNLKEAIVEWEMTLLLDSSHSKARNDITKAQKLLEKYRAIN